ncbi:MAG: hypothetical protein JWM98_2312 [Thermoleophilia bacterium]|nr:hypothetical protein [Thermoleophilia bacterium]
MDRTVETDPRVSYEVAALRLHLAVGMAAADGHVHYSELAELHAFVEGCDLDAPERVLLAGMLDRLLDEPPALDVLLRAIIERIDRPELAGLLIADLVAIANVDGEVDPREEGLLRLVCGALEVDPVTLYDPPRRSGADVTAAELASLVRTLLDLDPA